MPSATARDFQRVCHKLGFLFKRTTGSHERWVHLMEEPLRFQSTADVRLDRLSF